MDLSDLERNKPLRDLLTSKSALSVPLSHIPLRYALDARQRLRSVRLFDYGYFLCSFDGDSPGLIIGHINSEISPRYFTGRHLNKGDQDDANIMQHLASYPWVVMQSSASLLLLHVELGMVVRQRLAVDGESLALFASEHDHVLYGVRGNGHLLRLHLDKLAERLHRVKSDDASAPSDHNDADEETLSSFPICIDDDDKPLPMEDFASSFEASSSSSVLSPLSRLSQVVPGTPASCTQLLVGSDRSCQIWELESSRLLLHAEPETSTATFALVAVRYGCLVTVDSSQVLIFNYTSVLSDQNYHTPPRSLPHPDAAIVTAVHVDDSFVFLGDSAGKVAMHDRTSGAMMRSLCPAMPPLKSAANRLTNSLVAVDTSRRVNVVRRMGRYVLVGCDDGRFLICDVRAEDDAPPVSAYEHGDGAPIRACVVCPGGALVLGAWPSFKQQQAFQKTDKSGAEAKSRRPDVIVWRPRFEIAALLEDGAGGVAPQAMGAHATAVTNDDLIERTPANARGNIYGYLSLSCARVGTLLVDFAVRFPRSDVDELAATCEHCARSIAAAAELARKKKSTVLPMPVLFELQSSLDDYESAILRLRSSGRLSRFLGSTRLRLQIEQLNSRLSRSADAIDAIVAPLMADLYEEMDHAEEQSNVEEGDFIEEEQPTRATKMTAIPESSSSSSAPAVAGPRRSRGSSSGRKSPNTIRRGVMSLSATALWSEASGGKRAQTVPWEALRRALLAAAQKSDSDGASGGEALVGMKSLLDFSNTGFVSKFKFCELLRAFGPVTSVVGNVNRLFAADWFHGFLSSAEAEILLSEKPRGTFLIRVSQSSPGSLALAFVISNAVSHVLLTAARPRGFKVQQGDKAEQRFDDLWSLVQHYRQVSLFTRPLPHSLSLAPFFAGDLSREECDELLQTAASGTFCVRFSSSPQSSNPFTLSLCKGKKIRHVRISKSSETGCFFIENERKAGEWASVTELVRVWTEKGLLKQELYKKL